MNDLALAKHALHADSLAFVIAKDGALLRTGTDEGIGELIEVIDALGEAVHGACLADKVVGKAVAMIARVAKMREVYAVFASEAARDTFARENIPLEYDRLVPQILDKRGDGPCPMEQLTLPIDDPHQAMIALRDFARSYVSTKSF